MSPKSVNGAGRKKPASAATNLIAGGGAGMMEALACHPLGTPDRQDLAAAMLIWARHNKSPNAAIETSQSARSMPYYLDDRTWLMMAL